MYFCQIELEFFQTNQEVELLDKISEKFDGIVLNPAAWTHTSIALADRLKAIATPYIENTFLISIIAKNTENNPIQQRKLVV